MEIHDIDPATGLSRGRFIVDAAGNLVVLPPLAPLKASQRIATQDDIDLAVLAASAPSA